MTESMIGLTIDEMVTFESLGILGVPSNFRNQVEVVKLANGHARGMGLPNATIKLSFIRDAARDALRYYCPGVSADVFIYIPTLDNSREFKYFLGVMHWPEDEPPDAGATLDFEFSFDMLVEQEPPYL